MLLISPRTGCNFSRKPSTSPLANRCGGVSATGAEAGDHGLKGGFSFVQFDERDHLGVAALMETLLRRTLWTKRSHAETAIFQILPSSLSRRKECTEHGLVVRKITSVAGTQARPTPNTKPVGERSPHRQHKGG